MNTKPIKSGSFICLHVEEQQAHQRADIYIAHHFSNYSRSFLHKLFKMNAVTIHNKPIKPSYIVKKDDSISIQFPDESSEKNNFDIPYDIGITIITKENDFFIINKPAGLTVHPPDKNYTHITLSQWIIAHYNELAHVGAIDRPGIVHRLDRNTSGLMIIPRTNEAHDLFSNMFKERNIQKTYLALVMGHPDQEGSISYPIGRHPVSRGMMTHFSTLPEKQTARQAQTFYKTLAYYKDFSLVEIKPVTGRTHQIRVHFKAIGHPLLGDSTYGSNSKLLPYHALHAHKLEFTYKEKAYSFSSPLDPALQAILDAHAQIADTI